MYTLKVLNSNLDPLTWVYHVRYWSDNLEKNLKGLLRENFPAQFESLLNPKRFLFWTISGQAIALCLCGGPGKVHIASAAFGVASSSFHLPRGFLIPRPVGKQICFIAVSSVPELWRKGPRTVGWSSAFSNLIYCSSWAGEAGEEKITFSTYIRNCSRFCKSLAMKEG